MFDINNKLYDFYNEMEYFEGKNISKKYKKTFSDMEILSNDANNKTLNYEKIRFDQSIDEKSREELFMDGQSTVNELYKTRYLYAKYLDDKINLFQKKYGEIIKPEYLKIKSIYYIFAIVLFIIFKIFLDTKDPLKYLDIGIFIVSILLILFFIYFIPSTLFVSYATVFISIFGVFLIYLIYASMMYFSFNKKIKYFDFIVSGLIIIADIIFYYILNIDYMFFYVFSDYRPPIITFTKF